MVWMILAAVGIVALIGLLICLWKWEPSDLGALTFSPSDVGFRAVDVDADLAMIDEIYRNLGTQEEHDEWRRRAHRANNPGVED